MIPSNINLTFNDSISTTLINKKIFHISQYTIYQFIRTKLHNQYKLDLVIIYVMKNCNRLISH